MLRRPWLLASVLAVPSLALAQGQAPLPRPEALLPGHTILYFGTDDVDAMTAHGRASPVGRILAEQEVKDFLEKPVAELRKAIDAGLAAAKQHPALESVSVDLDKLLAGPYGRAFFALTHLELPTAAQIEAGGDAISVEVGLVVGLEPRPGAVDVLALVKQIVAALAQSETGGNVKLETVESEGFTYDRIQAPGGVPPLCFANVGGLSLLSLSERTLADIAQRARSGGASLAAEPAFVRSIAAVGPPSTGDVTAFMQLGRVMELARDGVKLAMTAEGEVEGVAIVDKVFDVLKLGAFGPVYASSTWRDGVAVSSGYTEIDPSAGGLCALAASRPIDLADLKRVPKDALAFSLASLELAPLYDTAMEALKQAAPEIHEMVASQIQAFETQAAGANEQGEPNWSIRRDLIGALAGRFMSVSTPGAASMFGPGGDVVFWIESPNPDGLEKSLEHLFGVAAQFGNPIKLKQQVHPIWSFGPNGVDDGGAGDDVHEDAELRIVDPMSLGPAAALAGSLQLTYSIHGGRFWFGTTTKALKKALDAAYKPVAADAPPRENITAKADFARQYVPPPKGAVLTALSYGDTAKNFENGYTAILGVIPMLMMGLPGGVGELPIDLALLPTADTISKHLFGTVEMSYRVGDHGHVTISRGPFGAETGLVIVGGAAAVGGLIGWTKASQQGRPGEPEREVEPREGGDPSDQARDDLAEISSAITVYMIEYDRPPETLDELVKPTREYPDGLLGGATALPIDPWGHAYAYKTEGAEHYVLWSFGPNGVDDGASGDDIVQRN